MDEKLVKQKILNEIKHENKMDGVQIGAFIFYVAKDESDLNNPQHPITIYNILCEMENEGTVENTCKFPAGIGTLHDRIVSSRWILK